MSTAPTTPTPLEGAISLEDWQKNSAFLNCTVKQQDWLRAYVKSGGDAKFASRAAYDTGNAKSVADVTYQTVRNPHVKAALRVFHGISEQEALLKDVQERLLAGKPLSDDERKSLEFLFSARGWFGLNFSQPGKLAAPEADES